MRSPPIAKTTPKHSGFDASPAINPATVHELGNGEWIRRGDPLCLIGDSGTGKSHLLIELVTYRGIIIETGTPSYRRDHSRTQCRER